MARTDVPAHGQLVTVRNRPWIAANVVEGTVAGFDESVMTARVPHVVELVSIEDDSPEEKLRVVWELEPGAVAHDRHVLPDPAAGFDEPGQLDAFLDAVRWGAIATADKTVLQAPFRSGITIEPYQLDPVVRALRMPRTNLLIADDVGLGKTIEAGLVMQELMLRHRARTMLIVCPAGLTLQWRDEMRDKFGFEFRIVDSTLLKDLRRSRGLYANPWTHYPHLIVSVDWLKRARPMRLLRDVLPEAPKYPRKFDLLVVDEVHTCAPTGRGRYAVDSQRTDAIRTLAPHCEHRLFLSATPHNGFENSFVALLEMLDPQRFARGVRVRPEQRDRIMVRRLKRELPPRWDGTPQFAERVTQSLEVEYPEGEQGAHEKLAAYAASRRRNARGGSQRTAADFVTTLLKKRLFSSTKAFAETVEKHLATMTAKTDAVFATAAKDAGEKILQPIADRLEETAEDDTAYAGAEEEAFSAVRQVVSPLSAEERRLLEELRDWAREAQDKPDAKFAVLRDWLDQLGPDDKAIIFTEYRDTQRWLHERLIGAKLPAERIGQLYGGMDEADRERIKTIFRESPKLDKMRILVATDSASEGINLQDHCHRLLHWEIPWNPNRLEQRNGRVDRHGQPADRVEVFHFVPAGWDRADSAGDGSLADELHFLHVAAKKVEQIREDLGSAGQVIAAQVEQKMLGSRPDWQTADAEIGSRVSRSVLQVRRELAKELQDLTETLRGSRTDLNLTPETVERVVRTALRLAHNKDLTEAGPPNGFQGRCFRLPDLPGAWAAARNDGLYHPLTQQERPVTFDDDRAAGRSDVVLLHLGHRLVQMCLRLLRAELWSDTGGGAAKLSRVTARVVPGDLLDTPAVAAHMRVVVTGDEGTRLHEEVIVTGGTIEAGKLKQVRAEQLEAWLAAASEEKPPDALLATLAEMWNAELKPRLTRLLETRANQRKSRLAADLEARCVEEVAAMTEVLAELDQSIRDALSNEPQWVQPSLYEAVEQEQLHKDFAALEARLASIPGQLETETEALRRRYANPKVRWFPAAVTFLVPASLAHRSVG